jgi:hypothetical protein
MGERNTQKAKWGKCLEGEIYEEKMSGKGDEREK